MSNFTKDQLAEILSLHKRWRVTGGNEGSRANLVDADLRHADLRSADLVGADLVGANLRSANLRSADLRSANLRSADLRSADLVGADLRSANGILQLGPIEVYMVYAVRWDDGLRIHAGCRWFTLAEAREHWGPNCADRREHGDLALVAINALTTIAQAHGWEV